VGVEPTGDRIACRPPVLKTGTITGPHALPFFSFNNIQLIAKDLVPARVGVRTEAQTRAMRRPRFPRCECSSRSTPWLLVRKRSMSARTPGNTAAGNDETFGPVKLSS
jgi:hypothetical protein